MWEEDYNDNYIKYAGLRGSVGFGAELSSKWTGTFNKLSIRNTSYALMVLESLVGQIASTAGVKIVWTHAKKMGNRDSRIHPFYIADSGSGKSVAVALIRRVCVLLGIPFHKTELEVKDSEMVGTDEDVIVGKIRKKQWKKGWISLFDEGGIVVWDEAQTLILAGEKSYNTMMPNYVMSIMEPIDSPGNMIEKKMKSLTTSFTCFPKCSIIFLCHHLKEQGSIKKLLEKGFLQRTTPLYRELVDDEWNKLEIGINESIIKSHQMTNEEAEKEVNKYEDEILNIVKDLKEIKTWLKLQKTIGGDIRMKISPEAQQASKTLFIEKLNNTIPNRGSTVFNSFRARTLVQMWTRAFIRAIMDKRLVVEKRDIDYASFVTLGPNGSLTTIIEGIYKSKDYAEGKTPEMIRWYEFLRNKTKLTSRMIRDKDGGYFTGSVKEILEKFFKVSTSTVEGTLRYWKSKGIIVTEGEGRATKYYF